MDSKDKPVPTEEQVKAANEAEEAKWQDDFKEEDLVIPYKQKDNNESEDKKDGKDSEQKTKTTEQEGKTDDGSSDEVVYSEPEPLVTVEDPGEYRPADYSFEVTLKDGRTTKVSTPEEADRLSEDPDNFETPKQLLDFIKKSTQMQNKLDKDYEKWESQNKTFQEQTETETQRRENIENFVSEFNYLVNKGLVPKIDKQYVDADWSDPEIAKQSGVKEQIALLNYMVKENEERSRAKIKPLTSMIDVYNAWMQDEDHQKAEAKRKEAEEAQKAAGEARKAAGARIAGVSPSQQGTYVPKGIAVGNPNVFKRGAAVWDN